MDRSGRLATNAYGVTFNSPKRFFGRTLHASPDQAFKKGTSPKHCFSRDQCLFLGNFLDVFVCLVCVLAIPCMHSRLKREQDNPGLTPKNIFCIFVFCLLPAHWLREGARFGNTVHEMETHQVLSRSTSVNTSIEIERHAEQACVLSRCVILSRIVILFFLRSRVSDQTEHDCVFVIFDRGHLRADGASARNKSHTERP